MQTDMDMMDRLRVALVGLVIVLLAGTFGYTWIEGWPLFDSLYMTVITLATIGFGEVHNLHTAGRVFTILLSLVGLGIMAYSFSTMAAFIISGELRDVLRRRKMEKRIRELKGHYIVCGGGFTGRSIVEELAKTGRSFVIIEKDAEKAEESRERKYFVIQDDALHEDTLNDAGIAQAKGLFCSLDSDRDNVFIALTARGLNPSLRIVSEVHDDKVRDMLLRSGVDAVVSSEHIGGLRMASEMIRPATVGFLDFMIRDRSYSHRFEEVAVREGSLLVGKDAGYFDPSRGKTPSLLAVKDPKTARYSVNPQIEHRFEAGDILVILGSSEEIRRFKDSVRD